MKLTQPSADILVLLIKPWRSYMYACIIFLTGIGLLLFSLISYRLVCPNKSPGIAQQCELKGHLLEFYQSDAKIGDITGTKIVTHYDENNHRQYDVWLITPDKPKGIFFRGLTTYSEKEAHALSQSINNYIQQSSAPSLKVRHYLPGWIWLGMLFFIPTGINMIRTSAWIRLEVNKATQIVTLDSQTLFKKTLQTFPFSEVSQFILYPMPGYRTFSPLSMRGNRRSFIAIQLKNNKTIPLKDLFRSSTRKKEAFINKLNEWLGKDQIM